MIELSEPVVIPAVSKQTYPGAWIKSLHIMANKPDEPIRLRVELAPYDPVKNKISDNNRININVDNFVEQMQQLPALSAAYDSVINAVIALGQAQGKI